MIWTLLALFAVSEVAFGLYLWRKHTARAEALAATDPEQAAGIRQAALRLAGVFLLSPFLILIAGWLALGPPDFIW
jgi:hypothetical protein